MKKGGVEKEVPVEKKVLGTDLFPWGRRIVVRLVDSCWLRADRYLGRYFTT
jgi:hypothetical protein